MTAPPDANLGHYALGFYAPGKGIRREACPYAGGMKTRDLWLARHDAALRGESLKERHANGSQV